MDAYLFILAGNQSGSTLLHNLFAQCPDAVTLNSDLHRTTYEGCQWVKDSMPNTELNNQSYVWTEMIESIQNPANYKWDNIKKTWQDLWRTHKNFDNKNRLFVQKSPSDVGRAIMIEENFENAWFVCQVRNPYVVAEGVARRFDGDIRRAARHAIKMLDLQKQNIEKVSNLLAWRYEDIPAIPDVLERLVNDSIPLVDNFSFRRDFYATSIDGYLRKGFSSLNDRQLARLDERAIRIMNEEFEPYAKTIEFFKYDRIRNDERD